MQNKTIKIVFTGGGTAGHLFPIVAVARKIREQVPTEKLQLYFIGPKTIGDEILTQENITPKTIVAGKMRRYLAAVNLFDLLFKLPLSVFQCLGLLLWLMPDVLFCKGGFGALPAALVAWLYRIPVIVHESDSLPGIANRLIGRLAQKIAVSFPEAKTYFSAKKTALTGNPMRENLTGGTKEQAQKLFGLVGDKPLLFITGGSQGAEPINTIIMSVLPRLLEKVEIIHQCGQSNIESIQQQLPQTIPADSILKRYYHFAGFFSAEQMRQAYGAADLILSRAGANSINEIANLGKPSILIPLPESAGDHQTKNAFAYAKKGGTVVLEQANLSPNILASKIFDLISNKDLLIKMAQAAVNFAYPDADEKLATETISLIK
ncbi:MAG: undecaprenyldiphospho-muramoylpentapeptide beta-N-acetylglucosaminyltransferase [Candidatus Portnoybacteria bacterium CG10_big_fil_rev_8_21_14_0_10_44_7]|uniref:UDP-N-acetylglucosamine--N-acetylmuramyl-(pentapeptide) pyrophosphoryl-undecaprenol N-acetylglucosamine transferase n=1 Tax=Candidatus Portnoybacteria bacterium CG10_big_fil_rev_8_21_14_0_10_44_7 TaxID=1974816 RepID=A0A2M8KIL0_9BACT|nr:MAG: undecaprenyldiphospho-muramoylpentapeptide beta-N-acetylglucosaminyltransferase [Candidatus Portnoybacteria bacterium CG10_big_fil_rev_8_21_14_0_10_44_7]